MLFLWFEVTKGPFYSLSLVVAGVATEKPGSHHYSYWRDSSSQYNLNTIYLFSETRRGYREAEVSEGSFKHLVIQS